MKAHSFQRSQRGVLLIEVMISIVIFAIGILSMISMQAVSVAAQNDSQYRAEAEHLIDQLTSQNRGEGGIARLTQLLLRSREAAITPLQEEIEAPLITRAPEPAA